MQPLSDETKRRKEESGGALRLRRAGTVPEAAGDMRKRLILALADTVDTDYADRSYPSLGPEKMTRPVSTDSRPPVLRMRGGASVSVQEAVAALVSGTTPPLPVVPAAVPAGRLMMNQKVEPPSGKSLADATAGPVAAGAPLSMRRKLEVRAGTPPPAPPESGTAFGSSQNVATRAPLIPLPIDAALGGKPSMMSIPEPGPAARKAEVKAVGRPKKSSPIGLGAVLVSLLLVLFLAGVFWMQRGGETVEKQAESGVSSGGKAVAAEAGPGAGRDAAETARVAVVNAEPAVEIGRLATVPVSVAWEMADTGWAGSNVVVETIQSAPVGPAAPVAEARPEVMPARVPANAAPVTAPVEVAEPRRPAASNAFQVFVESLRVTGVLQQTPVRAIIDGSTVFAGDVLEPAQGIRLIGADFEQRQLIFEDKTRAQVKTFY
jgi:hypothetical protein